LLRVSYLAVFPFLDHLYSNCGWFHGWLPGVLEAHFLYD